MVRTVLFLVLFALVFLSRSREALANAPFWRSKPAVFKRIIEDREIIVSAKSEDAGGKQHRLVYTSAGRIDASLNFTFEKSQEFSNYGDFLPYISESRFDKCKNQLWAKASFLGFSAETTVEFKTPISQDDKTKRIEFAVIGGFLKGSKGAIIEESIEGDSESTLASVEGDYLGKAPLPAFLMEWGFEVAAQKMEFSMRKHIEEAWQAQ